MLYFSQRDPLWANKTLGSTSRTMAQVGCTTTCIAVGGTWFNEVISPGELCKKLRYTPDAKVLWSSIGEVFKKMTFDWRFYSYDQKLIDQALADPNKVVLLNVDNGGHWVFALKRIPGTRTFWVHDPYPVKLGRRLYSGVVGGAILRRK